MKDVDLGWAAGFFEGEGMLTIAGRTQPTRSGKSFMRAYSGHINCTQRVREPLDKMQELFGGKVTKKGEGLQWSLHSKRALPFLGVIMPYIHSRFRKQEILMYIKFYSTTDHGARETILGWWYRRREK